MKLRSSGWRRNNQRHELLARARRVWQNTEPIGAFAARPFAFALIAFFAWYAVPPIAGANSIPHIDIACDAVTVSWESFPLRPVDLHVTVTQGDEITNASVSTDGAPDGARSVPVDLHSGTASAEVTWTLQDEHHAGPVTAELSCTPSPTTTTTTPESTTTSTPPTTVPETTTPTTAPVECGPDTLACTGSSGSPWAVGVGLYAVVLGAVFMALNRRRNA